MKIFIVFCCAAVVSLSCFCNIVYAQRTYNLTDEQANESEKLRAEYSDEKEELQIQLQKLIKDRDIAIKDKNSSLVERRNTEIKQTREKIKNLPKLYGSQFDELLTEEQKENKVSDGFYEKELAAELAKIEAAGEKEKQAAGKSAQPKPAQKKQPAKKAPAKTKKSK
ncbi:MAG: hypothetical protein LBL00_00975 [Endomicrobium sp.]|jgi:hypothetical protein|nr:hypothetical protein [Endomicrobium sp.]